MKYDFDQQIAKDHGVEEAIMYSNLKRWCAKNRADESDVHFHDGRYRTYNSEKAFSELMPFRTSRQVSRIIANLEKAGLIESAQRGKSKYVQTKRYTVEMKTPTDPLPETKEEIPLTQTGQGNDVPLTQTGQSIYSTDNKHITDSKQELPPSELKNEMWTDKEKQAKEIFDHWIDKRNLIPYLGNTDAIMVWQMKTGLDVKTIIKAIDDISEYYLDKNKKCPYTMEQFFMRDKRGLKKFVENGIIGDMFEHEAVKMKMSEYETLVQKHGKDFTDACVDKLNNYMLSSDKNMKKYKDHYRAILSRVVDAVRERREKTKHNLKDPRMKKPDGYGYFVDEEEMYEWYESKGRREEIYATYGKDYVLQVMKVKSRNRYMKNMNMESAIKPIPEDIKPLPLK